MDQKSTIIYKSSYAFDRYARIDLLTMERRTDCSFVVGSGDDRKVFRAHRLILATCSPVFDAMFYGPLSDSSKNVDIEVSDINSIAFEIMLRYMYGGKRYLPNMSSFSFDKIVDIYYAANKYFIADLLNICSRYTCQTICFNNACKAYEMAKMYNDQPILQCSINVIQSHSKEVIEDPSFVNISYQSLLEIFEMEVLSLPSQTILHDALLKWMRNYCEKSNVEFDVQSLRVMIDPALAHIDFGSMDVEELVDSVAKSPFFTAEKALALIRKQVKSSTKSFINLFTGAEVPPLKRTLRHLKLKREISSNEVIEID